jgi:hypothetical protein
MFPVATPVPDMRVPASTGRESPATPRQPKQTHSLNSPARTAAPASSAVTHEQHFIPSSVYASRDVAMAPSTPPRRKSVSSTASSPSRPKSLLGASYASWSTSAAFDKGRGRAPIPAEAWNTIAATKPSGPAAVPFSKLDRFVKSPARASSSTSSSALWPHQTLLRRYDVVDAVPSSATPHYHNGRKATEITEASLRPHSSTADALVWARPPPASK